MITTHEIHQTIAEVKRKCNNEYAKSYCGAALDLEMIDKELTTQILYILCNLNCWRGEVARKCKAELKAYLKQEGVK